MKPHSNSLDPDFCLDLNQIAHTHTTTLNTTAFPPSRRMDYSLQMLKMSTTTKKNYHDCAACLRSSQKCNGFFSWLHPSIKICHNLSSGFSRIVLSSRHTNQNVFHLQNVYIHIWFSAGITIRSAYELTRGPGQACAPRSQPLIYCS